MDRIILTDGSLNVYGFRLDPKGGDLSHFDKNPVMLYNHDSFTPPIGRWNEIKQQGEALTAVPEFDDEDKFAAEISRKYQKKFISAASVGIIPLAYSEAPEDMVPGQTSPTVTRWLLKEASLVSVPANGSAVRLYSADGKEIDLSSPEAIGLAFSQIKKETMKKNRKEEPQKLTKLQKIQAILSAKPGELQNLESNEESTAAGDQTPAPAAPAQNAPAPAAGDQITLASLQTQLTALSGKVTSLEGELSSTKTELSAEKLKNEGLETQLSTARTAIEKLAAEEADENPPANNSTLELGAGGEIKLSEQDKLVRARWEKKRRPGSRRAANK